MIVPYLRRSPILVSAIHGLTVVAKLTALRIGTNASARLDRLIRMLLPRITYPSALLLCRSETDFGLHAPAARTKFPNRMRAAVPAALSAHR
jgi:hypothetical protein